MFRGARSLIAAAAAIMIGSDYPMSPLPPMRSGPRKNRSRTHLRKEVRVDARSRYTPAGNRQNCGEMGISPKRFLKTNSLSTPEGRANRQAAERRLYDMRNP